MDFYYGFFGFTINQRDFLGIDTFKYKIASHVVGINFQILKPFNLFSKYLINWQGISSSTWYVTSDMDIKLEERDGGNGLFNDIKIGQFPWLANNTIGMESAVSSYILELTTGLQLFYFFNITGGLGISWHDSRFKFTLLREGVLTDRISS